MSNPVLFEKVHDFDGNGYDDNVKVEENGQISIQFMTAFGVKHEVEQGKLPVQHMGENHVFPNDQSHTNVWDNSYSAYKDVDSDRAPMSVMRLDKSDGSVNVYLTVDVNNDGEHDKNIDFGKKQAADWRSLFPQD